MASPSPSPKASENEDDDGDSDGDDDDENLDTSSSVARRWLLEWLALCHSWQKGGVILVMRVVMFLGEELVYDIFVRGSVYLFKGCSEDFLYLFFSLSFRYIVLVLLILWPFSDSKPYIYLIYIFDEVVITFFHLSLHVLFFFSLYAHASYLLYAIFCFCFTLKCYDEFCLKCFKNTGCQGLPCHELSSCKVFQEFVLG